MRRATDFNVHGRYLSIFFLRPGQIQVSVISGSTTFLVYWALKALEALTYTCFSLLGTQQMDDQSGFWCSVCNRVTLGKFIGGQQRSMQAALPPSTAPYSFPEACGA